MNVLKLKKSLTNSMTALGVTSVEGLKNDRKIEAVANKAYKLIPLLPFRLVIKFTLGIKGFRRLIFMIRDKMIETGSTDLSWLTVAELKSMVAGLKKS